jgi:hypothetical protein
MIHKEVFELTCEEIEMIRIAENKLVETNWTREGSSQEKGAHAEILVSKLLKLCDDIVVSQSNFSTELDEVLKVDIVVSRLSDPKDVFAFQIKSSLTGAEVHYDKFLPYISYQGKVFRTPWCLIVNHSISNLELLDLLMEELWLDCSIDFDFLETIVDQVHRDNNHCVAIKNFRKLNTKELNALRLIYNIGRKTKTFYLKG